MVEEKDSDFMFKLKQSLGLIYIPSLNTHPVVALLSSCKKGQIWACTALYNFINKLKQTQSHNWADTPTPTLTKTEDSDI